MHIPFNIKKPANILLLAIVYIPTIIVWIYLTFFFSKMYISEAGFAVRSSDSADMMSITGLLFQNSSGTTLDAHIIQTHIGSMDMLEKVTERVPFLDHYSDSHWDIFSRLKHSPTKEEFLAYWKRIVTSNFSSEKGIITVSVKAYTPEMAKAVNDAILACSEELVNQMNDRSHQDALRLTRQEVATAEERLVKAQEQIQQFRDDNAVLDPSIAATTLENVVAQLEAEAAKTQAELNATLQTMHQNTPTVRALQTRLEALQLQIANERGRIAGMQRDDDVLSSLVGDYTQLVMEEKFAQEQWVKSMAAFEAARLNMISQSRYLVPFQPPTLPEESLYPKPFLYTIFVFFGLLVCLGLVSLIIAAIKDHMGV